MHNKDGPRTVRVAGLVTFTVMAVGLAFLPGLAVATSNDACLECHDGVSDNFHNTSHGVYFVDSENGCQSCHGNGADHIADGGDPAKIINPSRTGEFGSAQMCLNCHNDSHFDEWSVADHNGADMNCTSCHKIHNEYDSKAVSSTTELCYTCHSEVRAASFMPSRHPIGEGKLSCVDCHSVHGGEVSFAMDNSGRELCFSCHAEKEGPFIYEHAPVEEDCMVCHTAHGSVADNLLKQSEPTLCLSCHPMHFHATVEGVEGEFTPPLAPDRTSTSSADAWKVGMLTKCTQCHTEIHGSDHPSQAISTGGAGLTR